MINPVIIYTLDSRLMERNTYLERSALGVSLDSGPTEGASCLEPMEQSVLSSSLAARPVEGVTEKVSDWKPVINPVMSYTLDSRLMMEGNTYLERSALGVSLDSGSTAGASCLKALEQSVLSSSLAARPVEGVTEKISDWKPVIKPVQDITPDGRPMEGTAYPEHSALGASLDSIEPVRQSVLNKCFKSSARPMLDPAIVNHTDVDDDIDTDLPENPAPMMNSQTNHKQSGFKSSARPMLDPDKVDNTDVNADVNTDLPENSAPMMNLGLEIVAIGCAAVSAGCRYPGLSSHGWNIRSTAGEFAGPCAGTRQSICELVKDPPIRARWNRGLLA